MHMASSPGVTGSGRKPTLMRILILMIAVLVMSACKQNVQLPSIISPYRIDIQQGNVVTQEMVSKLKAGMTRSQVRFVLGSPLVTDMFHNDRWDYVYLMQKQGKADERRRLTVIFDGDKMATLEGDVMMTDKVPESAPALRQPPAVVTPEPTPTAKPAPALKPEAAKPALKPPVAANPAPKPDATMAAPPAVPKPDAAASPAASPAQQKDVPIPAAATRAEKPAPSEANAPAADAEKADGAKVDVPAADPVTTDPAKSAPAAPADGPKADAVKDSSTEAEAAKTDGAKTGSAKSDAAAAKKDSSTRGPFGRMLDKIGF
jgi:outer membrane protein assembly factor BamE